MELKIFDKHTNKIAQSVGIIEERRAILRDKVNAVMIEMINSTDENHLLTIRYKEIAAFCDTIEEYTYCIHVFIFFLAKNGEVRA